MFPVMQTLYFKRTSYFMNPCNIVIGQLNASTYCHLEEKQAEQHIALKTLSHNLCPYFNTLGCQTSTVKITFSFTTEKFSLLLKNL